MVCVARQLKLSGLHTSSGKTAHPILSLSPTLPSRLLLSSSGAQGSQGCSYRRRPAQKDGSNQQFHPRYSKQSRLASVCQRGTKALLSVAVSTGLFIEQEADALLVRRPPQLARGNPRRRTPGCSPGTLREDKTPQVGATLPVPHSSGVWNLWWIRSPPPTSQGKGGGVALLDAARGVLA